MNNVLTLTVRVVDTEADAKEDSVGVVLLANSKFVKILDYSALWGEESYDFMSELLDKDIYLGDFQKDLNILFSNLGLPIDIAWTYWSDPQQIYILFDETWSVSWAELGSDMEVEFEYIGVLDLPSINKDNCYKEVNDVEK